MTNSKRVGQMKKHGNNFQQQKSKTKNYQAEEGFHFPNQ
jgi:hypothetical protein